MPDKQNNIILYTDTEGKVNVNVRFDDEKANTTVKNSLQFNSQTIIVGSKWEKERINKPYKFKK